MEAAGEVELGAHELARLAREATRTPPAIARYLSASEGWSEAATMLGGAFSKAAATRLSNGKDQ